MKVLGIETSADDTGIALIEANDGFGRNFEFYILANEVSSQTVHAEYGGIYPNLAKREHAKNLPILLQQTLGVYETTTIDAIAVTVGPGLEPCLWEGIEFAKRLAAKWSVPAVPVNHMEGHILVSLIEFAPSKNHSSVLQNTRMIGRAVEIAFPAVALLISGGHTELILMRGLGQYEYLGRTRDDAVGEAFDKVARMLELPYPGGPEISQLAERARANHEVSPHSISLPRPMLNENNFDFSFSGLKTAVLRIVEKHKPLSEEMRRGIAREFEDATADVLVQKTLRAVERYGASAVLVGGGVSANKYIRSELDRGLSTVNCQVFIPPIEFTGDNGLMIALAGYFGAANDQFIDPGKLRANGTLKLGK